jgi:hypothetical protein
MPSAVTPPTPIIHTGKDGRLADQEPEAARAIVADLAAAERAVVHFHGGLVNRAKGTALAARLDPVYRAAEATPAFFVWESGFLETIGHNLHEIEKEKIFKILVKTVLKHVVGKVTATAGQKAVGQLPFPKDPDLAIELQRLEADVPEEPYRDLEAPEDLDESSAAERQSLERELERDTAFQTEVRAIAATALPDVAAELDGSKGVLATQRKSTKTLLSPEVVRELEDDTEAGSKGLFTAAALLVRASKVLVRSIKRLSKGRGHGVYPTVVEEILRELYVANVGAEIWHQMKKETADTFVDDGSVKGGRLFVDTLGRLAADGKRPQITLVGHSTGAIFILNLLRDVQRCRRDPDHPWPEDFAFENVVFLAPACNFTLLRAALEDHRETFRHFRMFTMLDENEKKDNLVPLIYPRSLLYFVSGVVEREPDGSGAFDLPLVGMERYYANAGRYPQKEEIGVASTFLAEDDRRAVWSIADDGPGRRSSSTSHVGFDDTDPDHPERHATMASVQHMIRYGAPG